jgi:imidazolonepropionase-like amidohydrolase
MADQTVVLPKGKIEPLSRSNQVEVPEEAFFVNGEEWYLMPDLVDRHIHVEPE